MINCNDWLQQTRLEKMREKGVLIKERGGGKIVQKVTVNIILNFIIIAEVNLYLHFKISNINSFIPKLTKKQLGKYHNKII